MEPRIVDLGEKKLIGLPFYGDPAEGNFAKAWHRFVNQENSIAGRVNTKCSFGVEIYGPEFHETHQWTYFPCVEVSSLEQIPESLFAKTLPAAKYAVFTVTGGLSMIHKTFMFAYDEWIPASLYQVAYPFDFELYDERYHGDEEGSVLDICIPIKLK